MSSRAATTLPGQIWLGKWLGIVSLNAALLAISGFSVYGLLQWRATKLPEAEQKILRNEVLVARGSAREPTHEKDLEAEASRRPDAALADFAVAGMSFPSGHATGPKPESADARDPPP